MEEKHYIKAFNNGYLLAKHEPALAAQLANTPNQHDPHFEALMSGKAEYEKEVREWSKGFSRGGPAKDERQIDKER